MGGGRGAGGGIDGMMGKEFGGEKGEGEEDGGVC